VRDVTSHHIHHITYTLSLVQPTTHCCRPMGVSVKTLQHFLHHKDVRPRSTNGGKRRKKKELLGQNERMGKMMERRYRCRAGLTWTIPHAMLPKRSGQVQVQYHLSSQVLYGTLCPLLLFLFGVSWPCTHLSHGHVLSPMKGH
jgi:hypothetical protein